MGSQIYLASTLTERLGCTASLQRFTYSLSGGLAKSAGVTIVSFVRAIQSLWGSPYKTFTYKYKRKRNGKRDTTKICVWLMILALVGLQISFMFSI